MLDLPRDFDRSLVARFGAFCHVLLVLLLLMLLSTPIRGRIPDLEGEVLYILRDHFGSQ